MGAGEAREPVEQLTVDVEAVAGAVERLLLGAGPVGGQGEGFDAGEFGTPVADLAGEGFAGEPFALPRGDGTPAACAS